MKADIYSSNNHVIDSGSVILSDYDAVLKLNIPIEEEKKVKIEIEYKEDKNIEEKKADIAMNGDVVSICCINFVDSLGVGLVHPITIVIDQSRKLMFRFWTTLLGEKTTRRIDYTLYEENR